MKRAVLVLCGLSLLVPACSLGPREEWADAIHDAHLAAARSGTAGVRAAADVSVIETVIRQDPKPLIARLEGVVDFEDARARLTGSDAKHPVVMFDELVVYLPRSATSIAGGSRHWASYDFTEDPEEDLDDVDRLRAVGAGLISPVVAVDLLRGALTGSIDRVGTETIGGEQATHYRARISQDSASREIEDEDRSEGTLRLLESLGVNEDIFPAEVWLDDQGLPRRIIFVLRQQKDRANAFRLRLAWEFADYGDSIPAIALPRRGDTIRSPRVRAFIEEYIREAG